MLKHNSEISKEELEQRIALLKKFRSLLEQQRKKFQDYLHVLETQAEAITEENIEKVVSHTELEQSIVSEISSIQKVIVPFEHMYKDLHPHAQEDEIPRLQTDLEDLKEKVLIQNEKNRNLLKTHMNILRQQIQGITKPFAKKASVYASEKHTGSVIDIEF